MPTILDTLGIATCTISYGKEGSFAGKLATVSIQVVAKALGVNQLRLTWAATGDMFSSFTDSSTGTSGTPGIIVLPQTGQNGFRHGTVTFRDWYYEATVVATLDDGQSLSRIYRFQIPAGTTSLDLDMLDEDGVVTILPAIAPILPQTALSRTTVKTGAYTAGPNELVPVDATTAAVPITLPAAPVDKARVLVKKLDASTNPVTLTTGTGDVFNKTGGITAVSLLLMGQAVTVQYDAGTAIWTVLSDDLPLAQLDSRYPSSSTIAATYATQNALSSGLASAASSTAATYATQTALATGLAGKISPADVDSKVSTAVSNLLAGAPGALDTLKELADAINDDANFAATVNTALAARPTAASVAATYVALRGAWTAGAAFPKNSLVIQAGAVYLATADVPARATFTAADWQALGGTVADLVLAAIGNGIAALTGTGITADLGGIATLSSSLVTESGGLAVLAA